MEDQQHLAMRQQPFSQKQRYACEHPHISVLPSPSTNQVSFSHTWWFTFVTTCPLTALWNDMCTSLLLTLITCINHKRKSCNHYEAGEFAFYHIHPITELSIWTVRHCGVCLLVSQSCCWLVSFLPFCGCMSVKEMLTTCVREKKSDELYFHSCLRFTV